MIAVHSASAEAPQARRMRRPDVRAPRSVGSATRCRPRSVRVAQSFLAGVLEVPEPVAG